jgi:transcriptional regulator with XRE-family HTH domain
MGKGQLSKYENSKELPKLDSLEKVLKVLGVGYFEFFCTLRSVDDRAASMGAGPSMPALPILQEAYGSILHPTTQAAFQTVLADYLKLHAHVVEEVVLGRLDEKTLRGGRHLLVIGTEEDGSEETFE